MVTAQIIQVSADGGNGTLKSADGAIGKWYKEWEIW